MAIPITALLGPALVSRTSFAMRDAGHFYYPLFQWCAAEWGAGRVPLWNPYENTGVPILADASSSVFYPGKLLFVLPLSFALRYKLYIVLHVALAAGSSYLLARKWQASRFAAALAAIAYSCGGSVVFQYANVVFLVGAAWLPLAVWAIDAMLRGGSWPATVWLGIVLALMVLGGDAQMAYHVLMAAGLYVVVWRVQGSGGRQEGSGVRGQGSAERRPATGRWPLALGPWLLALGRLALAAAIAFLLAAVQILPTAEATRYSERAAFERPRNVYEAGQMALRAAANDDDTGPPIDENRVRSIAAGLFGRPRPGSHHEAAFNFSVSPWRLVEYIWPNIGGRMFPTNRRWFSLLPAAGRIWTPTLYMGLLPVVLAICSLQFCGGDSRRQWLSWLALIGTLASFGFYGLAWLAGELAGDLFGADVSRMNIGPAVGGVYWLFTVLLPGYIYFRYPAKLLPLVALALSQLAAKGLDAAHEQPSPRAGRWLLVIAGLSASLVLPAWVMCSFVFGRAEADPSLGPFDVVGARRDVVMALMQTAAVALAGWWLVGPRQTNSATASWSKFALVLLVAVELSLANGWLVATAPASIWQESSRVARAMTSTDDNGMTKPPLRVYRGSLTQWRPPGFAQAMSNSRMAELVQWEHDTLFPKHHLTSRVSLVEAYGSIKLLDYECLLQVAKAHGPRLSGWTPLPQPAALRLLGTEFLVLPTAQQPPFADLIAAARDRPGPPWPESANVWRMTRTLPRAWIVHEVESLPPLEYPARPAMIERRTERVLFPAGRPRDFERQAVVEAEQPPEAAAIRATNPVNNAAGDSPVAAEQCQFTRYSPQHVTIEVRIVQPGLLVFSDAFLPGWQAVRKASPAKTARLAGVDQPVPIYRTNRVLRGVWLEAGHHTVEFRYRPVSFIAGVAISASAWLAVSLGLAISWVFSLRQT
jgi:hypothetical protein